jgi:hypothetical protein
MKMSYADTRRLILDFLAYPKGDARKRLHHDLRLAGRTEGEFYRSITEHAEGLKFTTGQWFELLSRLPNRILRSDLDLPSLLSEDQIQRLPPVTG